MLDKCLYYGSRISEDFVMKYWYESINVMFTLSCFIRVEIAAGSLKFSWIFSWLRVRFTGFQENMIEDKLKPGSRCLFSAGKRVMRVFV